jgi:hypothetical protein
MRKGKTCESDEETSTNLMVRLKRGEAECNARSKREGKGPPFQTSSKGMIMSAPKDFKIHKIIFKLKIDSLNESQTKILFVIELIFQA